MAVSFLPEGRQQPHYNLTKTAAAETFHWNFLWQLKLYFNENLQRHTDHSRPIKKAFLPNNAISRANVSCFTLVFSCPRLVNVSLSSFSVLSEIMERMLDKEIGWK